MGALSDRLVVGILGAGRMAQGYDDPHSPHVLSLAHAVHVSPGFRLGGFFDRRPERAELAERRWGCPPSPRARAEWLGRPWDGVLIATPDAEHGADLHDVLARKPRGIVVEKPVATDGAEGLRLLEDAERLGVPVLVDFPRRWHSGVAAVARDIAAGRLGTPIAATLTYSGGAAHSEIHVWCERGKVELSHSPEILELSGLDGHPLYTSFQVLTQRERFQMEHEPVLPRLMETLAGAIADPDAARALLRREIESQTFSAEVLQCLETPESFEGRA